MTKELSMLEKAVVPAMGVVAPTATYLSFMDKYVDVKTAAISLVVGAVATYIAKKGINSGED